MDALLGGTPIAQIHVVDGIVAQNGDPLRKLLASLFCFFEDAVLNVGNNLFFSTACSNS